MKKSPTKSAANNLAKARAKAHMARLKRAKTFADSYAVVAAVQNLYRGFLVAKCIADSDLSRKVYLATFEAYKTELTHRGFGIDQGGPTLCAALELMFTLCTGHAFKFKHTHNN